MTVGKEVDVEVVEVLDVEEVEVSPGTVSADADMEFNGVKYTMQIAVISDKKCNFFITDDHSHANRMQRARSIFSNGLLLIA